MGRVCTTHGSETKDMRILVENPEGKRPLQKPRCRWVGNIKIDLSEIGWGRMY
jgi:hypothetical protein